MDGGVGVRREVAAIIENFPLSHSGCDEKMFGYMLVSYTGSFHINVVVKIAFGCVILGVPRSVDQQVGTSIRSFEALPVAILWRRIKHCEEVGGIICGRAKPGITVGRPALFGHAGTDGREG